MRELIQLLESEAERSKAAQVLRQVKTNIYVKNYFGWRTFIEDVLSDLFSYMMATKFEYSAGAYVTCGMQSAIDHCRYCNALKRRGNFEYESLDDVFTLADETPSMQTQIERAEHCDDLYTSIQEKFGDALAEQLKPLIYDNGDKVKKAVLKECNTPEFKAFLTHFSR